MDVQNVFLCISINKASVFLYFVLSLERNVVYERRLCVEAQLRCPFALEVSHLVNGDKL